MTSLYGSTRSREYSHMDDLSSYRMIYNGKERDGKQKTKRFDRSIYSMLQLSGDFSIFLGMVDESSYKTLLKDELADITVFAPPNRVFHRTPEIVFDHIDRLSVDQFISYHIVKGRISLRDMKGRRFYARTYLNSNMLINGLPLHNPIIGRRFMITSAFPAPIKDATVMKGDIRATNGFIHTVSALLIPDNYY